ncbi:MAG: hypothetical protein MUE73_17070 [Planctomycetes bacterium]|jgi:hypothetical protein|nr:hypothetical protein [Planctomycetota bacterium]
MSDTEVPKVSRGMRWIGRALALVLLSLWGAFLVQHVGDLSAGRPWASPPTGAFLATALHVLVLAGFALMLVRGLPGSVLVVVATVAYVVQLQPVVFPWIAGVNFLPIPFLALAGLLARRAHRGTETPSTPAAAG